MADTRSANGFSDFAILLLICALNPNDSFANRCEASRTSELSLCSVVPNHRETIAYNLFTLPTPLGGDSKQATDIF